MKVIRDFEEAPNQNSITVVCVLRDEELLLPKFIEHYQNLGVTHFIFIDNGSTDTSIELIQKFCDEECRIILTYDSYAASNFGIDWAHKQLDLFCKNSWCSVVDVDEFILLDNNQSLKDLAQEMSSQKSNVCEFALCEFYPKSFPKTVDPFDPFAHSNYFDNFNDKDNYFKGKCAGNSFIIKGGVRHRVFSEGKANNNSCCLNKKSFYYYDFYDTHSLSVGMHWLLPKDFTDWNNYSNWQTNNQHINYFKDKKIIAHFKFVKPDLIKYFDQRLSRNEDWNNSSEYLLYKTKMKSSFFKKGYSEKFLSVKDLYAKTLRINDQSRT